MLPYHHPRRQFLSKYPFLKLISLAGLRWECFSKYEIDTLSKIEIEIQVNIKNIYIHCKYVRWVEIECSSSELSLKFKFNINAITKELPGTLELFLEDLRILLPFPPWGAFDLRFGQ